MMIYGNLPSHRLFSVNGKLAIDNGNGKPMTLLLKPIGTQHNLAALLQRLHS